MSSPPNGPSDANCLEPDVETMRRLAHLAVDRAIDTLANLGDRRVGQRQDAAELRQLLDEPLPREGRGLEETIERLLERVAPRTTAVHHPRFFAYIPGPGSFAGAIGDWFASTLNVFAGTWLGAGAMAELELQTLDWLRDAMGLPPDTWHGIVTSGGSIANLSGLAAARARLRRRHPTSRAIDEVILVSQEAHYSLSKAARGLGYPLDSIVALPVDDQQRIDPSAVRTAIAVVEQSRRRVAAVCATAGTTSTGAIDPLPLLADLCAAHGAWLHVDAAYGGAALLLEELRADFAGIERADSITLDPHKWLYAPFECGTLLTRDEHSLRAAFTDDAGYLQDVPRDEVNFFERGPELSRGGRALKLWFLFRAVGIDAIAAAIRNDIERTHRAAAALAEDPRIALRTAPRLSVFSFQVDGGEAVGRALVEAILEDGHLMLSSTRVDGEFAIRFCVANHRTTDADIDSSVARVRALLDRIEPRPVDRDQ